MYRVIIADDEPWVIYGLQQMINWEELGFTICATAADGAEALEKCLALRPDVLLCDIRMPGLDGLALLETLRKQMPLTQVVFISGYSEFDFAQHAVRYGAADYLVKQVSAKQLVEALERLKERFEKNMKAMSDEAYFALLDEDNLLSIAEWTQGDNKRKIYPHYRFITFSSENRITAFAAEHWTSDLGQFTLQTGRNKYSSLVGYVSQDKYREWVSQLADRAAKFIGISGVESGDFMFSNLYKQADIAFCTAMLAGVSEPLVYTRFMSGESERLLSELVKMVEEALKGNDASVCLCLLNQLSMTCSGLMLDRVAEIYNLLIGLFKRFRFFDADAFESYSYRRLASEFKGFSDIFEFFKQSFQANEDPANFLTQNIIQYIDDHYTEDLHLPDLAAQYHFSPSYFSALFKKKTGSTLIKYITSKRIVLAKRLLCESNLSIQDIVERVGYNDYFQFIKIFKREIGISPGQFRSTHTKT